MAYEVNLTVKFKLDSEEQAKLMNLLLEDWMCNGLFEKDLEMYQQDWAYSMAVNKHGEPPPFRSSWEFEFPVKPEGYDITGDGDEQEL
jgi:hypothetical protein